MRTRGTASLSRILTPCRNTDSEIQHRDYFVTLIICFGQPSWCSQYVQKKQVYMAEKNQSERVGGMTPPNLLLGCVDLRMKSKNQQTQEKALSELPYLPQNKFSKRNSRVVGPSLGVPCLLEGPPHLSQMANSLLTCTSSSFRWSINSLVSFPFIGHLLVFCFFVFCSDSHSIHALQWLFSCYITSG